MSILHRVSGAALFIFAVWLLYLLDASLASPERFDEVRRTFAHPLAKVVALGLIWAFMHHLCAGIRYLLLDIHKGIDLPTARATGGLVLAAGIALAFILWGLIVW